VLGVQDRGRSVHPRRRLEDALPVSCG
jgi:hypothetical protein